MKDMRNFFILELFVLVCLAMATSALYAGEVLHVDRFTNVNDDLVLIGKSCVMEGNANGDIVIINGALNFYGNSNGDVVVLGGEATLHGGSNIAGDIVIVGGKLQREEGANVGGEVVIVSIGPLRNLFKLIPPVAQFSTEGGEVKIEKGDTIKPTSPEPKHTSGIGSSWVLLVRGLALSIVIMILTAIFSSGSEKMAFYLKEKPGRSFLAGFLAQILFIPAIIVLVFSIVGILFIPFFILAYPIALLIGLIPSSLSVGKRITEESVSTPGKSYLQSFIGLFMLFFILFLAELLKSTGSVLQVIGWVFSILTFFVFYLYFTFGLGCLILSKLGTKKP